MISEASYLDLLIVASTMRESDRAEIYATRFADDPFDVAAQCNESQYKFVYRNAENALVAAFGVAHLWPHVWSVWLFANDLWDERTGKAIVRFTRRRIQQDIKDHAARRLECRSLSTHADAHRFIEAIGLRRESVLPRYGRDGEDFIVFALIVENVERTVVELPH